MKARLSKIIFLVWSLLWAVPAHSLDATSFNPTAVEVTAKATSSIPVGTIISWPVAQNPADWQNSDGSYNWLECNGQSISKTVYPELFALVGGQVPDLRGLFFAWPRLPYVNALWHRDTQECGTWSGSGGCDPGDMGELS